MPNIVNMERTDETQSALESSNRDRQGGGGNYRENGRKNSRRRNQKPASKKDVVIASIIASFITLILTLGSVLLITFLNRNQRLTDNDALLAETQRIVDEGAVSVALRPSQSAIQRAIGSNVNITVTKGADNTEIERPVETSDTEIGSDDSIDIQANMDTSEDGNIGIGADNNADANMPEGNTTAQNGNGADTEADANTTQTANSDGVTVEGAGVIVSSAGDIVTSLHVIENASEIVCTINGVDYVATVTGIDRSSDIATIKINPRGTDLPVAAFGDSNLLAVGDWVMAVGNPYGMNDSVSVGAVSALGRNLKYANGSVDIMYANMVQTDAAVNPGSSGGGLYDAQGMLIGLVTVINTSDGASNGVSYAIPINYVRAIAQNLVNGKEASHAVIGAGFDDVSEETAERLGLSSTDGAQINYITPAGPAEAQGLIVGDIIIEFDDKHVSNTDDLLFKIRGKSVGETIGMKVLRSGKEMSFRVRLGSDV